MKVAVIGVGRMGRIHIQVVRDLGLELVGICDQSAESLEVAVQEQGVPTEQCFADAHQLLQQTRPECVIVATTAPSHCEYTCMAAEAGAGYILCEKPMAIGLAQCDKMIAVCKRLEVKLAINHQMRFMQQYVEPKGIAESEAFGGLSSVTVVAGNLGMAMNGTHYFEMFRFMTNEAPFQVTAWFSPEEFPNPRGPQFIDRAGAVRLTTASGKRFYMDLGADQGIGTKVIYSGPCGQLVVDEQGGTMHLAVREARYRTKATTQYRMPWIESQYKIADSSLAGPTQAVLDALLNDKGAPTGEDGRLAVAVLVAAHISDEKGNIPVAVGSPDLPLDRVFPWP